MAEFNKYATGAAIKKLRCEKKISQEVLSGLAGIARSHLAMIESGKKQANFETIWKISSAFNVHPNELVRLIEEETERIGSSE
ncbi:MAG: helix-turn-helix transcriptional regulator [Oscillospiraceae bacterium]|nr:helix-turn-helix domain-containing protein [Oscillospiraceae bacterium]MCI6922275.1 helix-turn-helix domain-containing protein [Oscillospiraceae bacterium]MCI6969255.1 helix-turn-helix domain-containing protein [Oscillospiraceae bacterium]MCI7489044.1 helix-turn-helix domain-containing protein [Oscillospiraceae bacterium]MDD6724447.1 helix-turn-helix transcriptional regulator [Oscillospiraceae bacterium]